MKGYKTAIEKATSENTNFRRVLYTGVHTQLVLMTLKPGEDIGLEIHIDTDQFFRFELGEGEVTIDGVVHVVVDGDAVVVPAGAEHNIKNTSATTALHLYTLYSPPHHKDGTVHITKADALASDEEFDGQSSE